MPVTGHVSCPRGRSRASSGPLLKPGKPVVIKERPHHASAQPSRERGHVTPPRLGAGVQTFTWRSWYRENLSSYPNSWPSSVSARPPVRSASQSQGRTNRVTSAGSRLPILARAWSRSASSFSGSGAPTARRSLRVPPRERRAQALAAGGVDSHGRASQRAVVRS
jgi:hypothetical protein